ncbi:MAG: polysaccharide biosynthesis/export family protein [Calditrichia bacterium]
MFCSPRLIMVLLIVISGIFLPLRSQSSQGEGSGSSVPRIDVDVNQLQRSSGQVLPQAQLLETSFEKTIDPDQYILGPGDQLLVKVWGTLDNQFTVPISPEGYIILPEVAEVHVADKTLAEGASLLKAELKKAFRNSKFSVRLVRLRKFRVHVTGEVSNPGSYYLRSVDRISNAVELAGGLAGWGDDTRITIRNTISGEEKIANISDFYLRGDVTLNFLLRGGDLIYVPPIDLSKNYAIIEGNVGSQGIYQIRKKETLFAFLTRLRTINRKSNIESVVLNRGPERIYFNLLDPSSGARTELLQTGDRVTVPSTQDKVYVQGEVLQPGALPYLANYTSADYAAFAGLLETAKSLDDIYVLKSGGKEKLNGSNVIVGNGDIVVVPRKRRETFKDYLTILTPIVSIGISAFALIRASN